MGSLMSRVSEKTIRDFGHQWKQHEENSGYYASMELFKDIISPLLRIEDLKGARVAEIGSGTGRIVNILLESGVRHVFAVEPSESFNILRQNVSDPNKVTCLKIKGGDLQAYGDLDFVFCIGSIHHILDPKTVITSAYNALRKGGRMVVWLYGYEGIEIYVNCIKAIRFITTRIPDTALRIIVRMIDIPLVVYMHLCSRFKLPFAEYSKVLMKLEPLHRRLTIFDQLNPNYAKYYKYEEALNLLSGRFQDIKIKNRRNYSWTVVGTK